MKTIHCQEFHELAMDYRAAPPFAGASAAYEALCNYIDARLQMRDYCLNDLIATSALHAQVYADAEVASWSIAAGSGGAVANPPWASYDGTLTVWGIE